MDAPKLEYDKALGGEVELDNHVATFRYAAAALNEIVSFVNDINKPQGTKLIFQTLPRHMRRRAMSHHPKRLPRKYRNAHTMQMGKDGKAPCVTKRPSRKHRRRPQNLLKDYVRRQRQHAWLETHIWHAKRFHMINRWGYRLAYASCDKTYRACYRASTQHCLLQDISYYACMELHGPQEQLIAGLNRLTSQNGKGRTIGAKAFLTGQREGSIALYSADKYPLGALGQARYLWHSARGEERQLWLWLHPAIYTKLLEELIKVFDLTKVSKEEPDSQPKQKVKPARRLQFLLGSTPNRDTSAYSNAQSNISLRPLQHELNRFRLTGPLAQSVLAQALRVCTDNPFWLSETLSHEVQKKYWSKAVDNARTPSDFPTNLVIGLNVVDPRLQQPKRRTKATPALTLQSNQSVLYELPATGLATSALWQSEARQQLRAGLLSAEQYYKQRRRAIVPGLPTPFERDMQPVPVLLIQRPGAQNPRYKRRGYGCGWDIVLPAGYALPFWRTFNMLGARPGGLREHDTIAREQGCEMQLPDTIVGRQQLALAGDELQAKYFRLPSNKRFNYQRLCIASPFRVPLRELVTDWQPDPTAPSVEYYVLRDVELLSAIDAALRGKRKSLPADLDTNCLVQVELRMQRRGSMNYNSLICLPTTKDFKTQLKHIKHKLRAAIYTEPVSNALDKYAGERKTLRHEHKRLLKRLRARRVREKRKLQETSTQVVKIRPANTAALVATQFDNMCRLWVPPVQLGGIRTQGSRDVCGYVTCAAFSNIEAAVCGVGYMTTGGLCELLKINQSANGLARQPSMCLVRDTSSRDYHFAHIKVNLAVSATPF